MKSHAPAAEPRLELVVQTGHTTSIMCVALNSGGKYLVTGSDDNLAILWEAASGMKLRIFQGHSRPVTSVALTSDGKHREVDPILWTTNPRNIVRH